MKSSKKSQNYQRPSIQVIEVRLPCILAGSPTSRGSDFDNGGHFRSSSRYEEEITIDGDPKDEE